MKIAKIIIGDINRLTGGYLYQKKLVEYLRGKGAETDVISLPDMPYIVHFFSNLWLLIYFLRRRYDIIIEDEMICPAVWLFNLWAKHVKKAKIIAIVHLLQSVAATGTWRAPFVRFIEKSMLRSTHLIIANSEHTEEELKTLGLPSEAIKMVYPGFDVPFAPQKQPRFEDYTRLLFVANCEARKGLGILVEAMYYVDNPKIILDVVGDENAAPRYTKRVKERIAAWGLEGRIRFHGQIDRQSLGRFYAEADIFVLPSLYEPFGIVLAEAMSFRLPIIATKVGGIPELVEHEENGLLVPPKDVGALTYAIGRLASSAELRQELGRKGYERAKTLNTWEDCCGIVFDCLQRLQSKNTSG